MNYDEILKKIIRRYGVKTDNIRMTQVIESKLKKHTANYADAEEFAREVGKALTDAFREYLPEALTDGKLYRAAAEVLVEQPMKMAGRDVAEIASRIQQQMNEDAGLGMNPVVPQMNQDQIDGIITGICNADSYEAGKETLMDQVGNCMEGYVDDFVRENADFQYKAGLSPTIERRADGKCCAWCSALAGRYLYQDVSDRGNDVFRRHRNCHCLIMFNPGDGSRRRQNVHSRQWTEEEKADRIAKSRTVGLDLQKFSGDGGYRAAMYQDRWQKASLKETVQRLVPGAEKTENRKKAKVIYSNTKSRYQIIYDKKGDYFRIEDKSITSRKRYVGLNGEQLINKTENGKTIGREDDEYEMLSHFKNTDKEGRRRR